MTEEQIALALRSLEHWERQEAEIVASWTFPSFPEAVRFVTRVADLAEAADHHPDIDIRYRRVRLALTTHDQGGLTAKDFSLARQINQTLEG